MEIITKKTNTSYGIFDCEIKQNVFTIKPGFVVLDKIKYILKNDIVLTIPSVDTKTIYEVSVSTNINNNSVSLTLNTSSESYLCDGFDDSSNVRIAPLFRIEQNSDSSINNIFAYKRENTKEITILEEKILLNDLIDLQKSQHILEKKSRIKQEQSIKAKYKNKKFSLLTDKEKLEVLDFIFDKIIQ